MKPVRTAETFREMDLIIIKRLYGSGDKESPVKVNKHSHLQNVLLALFHEGHQ